MDWIALAAVATSLNVSLLTIVVFLAYVRTRGLEKNRKFQIALTIFEELQTQGPIDTRKYIYDNLPENIEGVDSNQLKAHIHKAELALLAFDRIGYLVKEKHIDGTAVMENYWSSIWRCWKKSKNIINWAREQRGQKDYFKRFEYLFGLSEDHRVQNGYEEPKFY